MSEKTRIIISGEVVGSIGPMAVLKCIHYYNVVEYERDVIGLNHQRDYNLSVEQRRRISGDFMQWKHAFSVLINAE